MPEVKNLQHVLVGVHSNLMWSYAFNGGCFEITSLHNYGSKIWVPADRVNLWVEYLEVWVLTFNLEILWVCLCFLFELSFCYWLWFQVYTFCFLLCDVLRITKLKISCPRETNLFERFGDFSMYSLQFVDWKILSILLFKRLFLFGLDFFYSKIPLYLDKIRA